MESLTKDIFYRVRTAATSWGKRRKRNGLGRGKDRESMVSQNGRQMTITSAEVQGSASMCTVFYEMISSDVINSLELEHLFTSCQRPSRRHSVRNPPGFHRIPGL